MPPRCCHLPSAALNSLLLLLYRWNGGGPALRICAPNFDSIISYISSRPSMCCLPMNYASGDRTKTVVGVGRHGDAPALSLALICHARQNPMNN